MAGAAPAALADRRSRRRVRWRQPGHIGRIIAVVLDRVRPGGRLVVNAVTLDNVAEAYAAFRRRRVTPEVMVVNVVRANRWRITCVTRRSIRFTFCGYTA